MLRRLVVDRKRPTSTCPNPRASRACHETFAPAYFALVMATGIVSIGARDFQLPVLAMGLFAVNLVAYAVLTGLRAIRYPRLFFADMTDHRLGPGFFTAVAGSCIIGTQFLLLTHNLAAATVFLALGVALWIVLTYTIFAAFTVKRDKPPIEQGLTGAWLIAVVATQSIAVLAALIARDWPQPHRLELNFFALSFIKGEVDPIGWTGIGVT